MRLRVDRKPSPDKLHSLLHAYETETFRFESAFTVKPSSRIVHGELNGIRGETQLDIEMPDAAVLHGVLQSFLRDSEEAERNILGKRTRDVIIIKNDFDILLIGKLM